MKKSIGTHIMGDLTNCDSDYLFKINLDTTKKLVSKIIKRNNFTELGSYYHHFDNNSFTGVISLSESHISMHTWPELGIVNIDVYTCNYENDNTNSTRKIFDEITSLFGKSTVKKIEIQR
jgi:S-adenosylmethionine decarboxylase